MQRFSARVAVILLAYVLHRLARAIFGFPLFSLTDFSARELAVDFGVYVLSFLVAYFLIRAAGGKRDSAEQ
ncbi:MAG TPA: hypothetical protein PLM25_01665 [Limnochordia bacterium]|nr:hypothetical protein [Limnochordia bacterium]